MDQGHSEQAAGLRPRRAAQLRRAFLPLERGACNDGGGIRRGQAQGGAGQELAAILAGCIEGITLNTAAYGREAAYSEPRLKTLDGRAKVPKQLRMDHKQCLPQLR